MGCDIHITVGRVNQRLLSAPEDTSEGTSLVLFNNRRLRFGDFEFSTNIPKEVGIGRNYDLFAFLAGIRGEIKPFVDSQPLRKATAEFMEWINKEYQIATKNGYRDPFNIDGWGDLVGSSAVHYTGDYSCVFYPVDMLRQFDYDQVALVENEKSDFDNPLYFPDKEERTYRNFFVIWGKDNGYFKFLEWCKMNNWQFVIFGFGG